MVYRALAQKGLMIGAIKRKGLNSKGNSCTECASLKTVTSLINSLIFLTGIGVDINQNNLYDL